MADFLAAAWVIARKDLLIERRNRTALLTAVCFAVVVQLTFVFARPAGELALPTLAPTVIWITVALSALLVLNRGFLLEREHDALDGILLAPVSRAALFWGKWFANTLLVALVMLIAVPTWLLFFAVSPVSAVPALYGLLLLGAAGCTAAGTLFAAMTARTRYGELLLPMMVLPCLLPAIYAGSSASVRLLGGRPFDEVAGWLRMLAMYDVVLLTLASMVFSHLVDE